MKCSVPLCSAAAAHDAGCMHNRQARSRSAGCGTAPARSCSSDTVSCNRIRIGLSGATCAATASLCAADTACSRTCDAPIPGGTPCRAQTWCRRAPQIAPLVCAVVSPGSASKHLPVSNEMQHIQNTPGPKRRPSVQVAHPTIPSCLEPAQTGGASIRRWPPMRLRKDRTCISHKSCAHHYVVSNGPLATPCKTRPCQHLPRRRWARRLGAGPLPSSFPRSPGDGHNRIRRGR